MTSSICRDNSCGRVLSHLLAALILAFFSERRLRPVIRTESDEQKIAGLLGLIDECERQLEEENRSLDQVRERLNRLTTVDSDPVALTPKSREHWSIHVD